MQISPTSGWTSTPRSSATSSRTRSTASSSSARASCTTYNILIAKGKGGGKYQSRLEQIIDWCGGDSFDGLIMLDECHKVRQRRW
mmetsp:Transcript_32416/g.95536  ORF Transcript_32416/g.95536 Transcript_32416/m.95536 type:complete len:85 (+) Transcript_32416:105-359(+)